MEVLDDVKRILDDDEEILKSYKPNKKRFVFINILFSGTIATIVPIVIFVIGLLGLVGVIPFVDEAGNRVFMPALVMMIFGGVGVTFLLVNCTGFFVRYNKAYYYVTNKRLIVRGGFVGVDYRSLQLSAISMVDVRVDFLDKLVKNNTGTIIFGSSSTPVVNGQHNSTASFSFSHIDNPYDAYKEIKEIVFQNNK